MARQTSIERRLRRFARAALVPLAIVVPLGACDSDDPGRPIERDLAQIREAGDTLTALVTYNSTGYFIYRGEPMGFEYRLLLQFAEDHDLTLQVKVVRDRTRLFHLLNAGEGDVVAARVVPAPSDTPHVAYTRALYSTRATAVQREGPPDVPEAVDTILFGEDGSERRGEPVEIRARLIQRPADLAGEEVHIPRGTFFEDRLVELSDTLDEEIHVVQVDSSSYETLLRRLAQGEIQLTIAPENIAKLREDYYTNLIVRPLLGPQEPVTWAVRSNADGLLAELNEWIGQAEASGLLRQAYQRYFVDRKGYNERVESEYLTTETGRLSEFDDLLKEHAPAIEWDWRLLASQTFQESRFDPSARSWAGAMGLLQLMPGTAREVDVSSPYDPEDNVAGAVRYLGKLTRTWQDSIPDDAQRIRFILASYNTGAGHVGDAQRLAVKHGDDPTSWEDVAYWLLQKSKRQYYTDPVVRYGFARGLEPVTYVARILDRYNHYREFVQADGALEMEWLGGGEADGEAER